MWYFVSRFFEPNQQFHMNTITSSCRHPVPLRYHDALFIGELDRRGNRIDFKIPPIVVESPRPILEYKQMILAEHVEAESLPMVYSEGLSFIVLRPSALSFKMWLREEIENDGLSIHEEVEIDNFMRFSDVLYLLNPDISFHWKWRAIMRVLHEAGTQEQNHAAAFVINSGKDHAQSHERLVSLKKRIRHDMGETPVIIKSNGVIEIALGVHHLHVPEFERVRTEFNTLMHAVKRTSVFA